MDCLRRAANASLSDPERPVDAAGAWAKTFPVRVLAATSAAIVAREPRRKKRRSNLPGNTSISFSDSTDMRRLMSDIGFRMVHFLRVRSGIAIECPADRARVLPSRLAYTRAR